MGEGTAEQTDSYSHDLRVKPKLSGYSSNHVPTLIYDHGLRVVTEGRVQVSEMSFF